MKPKEVKKLLKREKTKDGKDGALLPTIENFLLIFQNDDNFMNIKLNTMSEAPEIMMDMFNRTPWKDEDDSAMRLYLETEYEGIHGKTNIQDAFNVFLSKRKCSPIQEIIKSIEWDGMPHCKTFFINWAKSHDDDYSRECGRLFFAEGIARAFEPGSKCDFVPVLVGNQEAGKSTLAKWLAIDKSFYAKIDTLKGKDGKLNIEGKWIIELDELLATTGENVSVEEVKQFISSDTDRFRAPFGRYSFDHERTCVFIGTTNKAKFLTDPTGNRRWFPLYCNQTADNLFEQEEVCRSEINQCWAEMYHLWKEKNSESNPYPKKELKETILKRQQAAEIDDIEIGLIKDYLKEKDIVCLAEVIQKGLGMDWKKIKPTERNAISAKLTGQQIGCTIITTDKGKPSPKRFTDYGQQQAYRVPESIRSPKDEESV